MTLISKSIVHKKKSRKWARVLCATVLVYNLINAFLCACINIFYSRLLYLFLRVCDLVLIKIREKKFVQGRRHTEFERQTL